MTCPGPASEAAAPRRQNLVSGAVALATGGRSLSGPAVDTRRELLTGIVALGADRIRLGRQRFRVGIGVETGVAVEAGELGVRGGVEMDVVVALGAGRILRANGHREGSEEPGGEKQEAGAEERAEADSGQESHAGKLLQQRLTVTTR